MDKIWIKTYPTGVPAEISIDHVPSLVALFEDACRKYADKMAYVSMGQEMSYGELDRLTRDFAGWLQSLGLQKGDRVALMMPNLLQYPVALFGTLRAGCVVVNCNPLYTPRELEHQLKDSGAEAIVIVENFAKVLENVVAKTPVKHVIVTQLGDMLDFPKRMIVNLVVKHVKKMVPAWHIANAIELRDALIEGGRHPLKPVEVGHDDLAFLQYTGGTTGVSKGAMLSHGNIVANMQQAGVLFSTYDFREGEETLLLPLPLYHIYAFNACLGMLARGAHTVLLPNPRDLQSLVAAFRDSRCSGFAGLNTLFVALCNDAGFRALDFSRLKVTMSGGMALTMAAARRWKEVTGVEIVEGYGMSETSPVISLNPVNANHLGTIGIAVPSTEVRILDDDGNEVEAGEPGELVVRGPQVMLGYWNQAVETAKVLSPEGWLHTGDVAVVTPQGYLKIVDRKKDMVVVSGFNVYPNEIEEVVVAHPDVLECAVVGIPDERTGEALRVFVVPRHPGLTEKALRDFCRENLTGYKMPREFVIRTELPKSNVGKILRRELRGQ